MFKSITVAALLGTAISAHAANLVTNGSFETSSVGSNHQFTGTELNGWTTSTSPYSYNYVLNAATATTMIPVSEDGNSTDDRRLASLSGPSPDGGNFVGLDADTNYRAALGQQIAGLTPGRSYAVKFDWAGTQNNYHTGPTTDQLLVSLGGTTQSTPVINVASKGFNGWFTQTFVYKATSASETLTFLANGTPHGNPPFALLDGVSVAGVPEASTWAMLIAGMGLIGAVSRRRNLLKTA